MEPLDIFLARHPPFSGLSGDVLREFAATAALLDFEGGETILHEDGPPAAGLWAILAGSMELLHEREVVQVLEPGECFGHPSLLTGMSPTFTVRAHEPSRCAWFDAGTARRLLGTPPGSAYVAGSMRQRLTRTGHTVHALLDVGTTPVSAIMRPPTFCEANTDLASAAAALSEEGVSALVVRLGPERLGTVSDAEIRAAVAAGPGGERRVGDIARTSVPTIPVGQLAVEALIDMLAASSWHAVVVDGEQVSGVVAAGDLLGLEARSPMALRHRILGAADQSALVRAARQLPKLFVLLARARVPAQDIGRVLTLQHDAVVARLLDFSIWQWGDAPVPWAWLNLGSAARREFTLSSDQDNALAYADPGPDDAGATDAYFARLGGDVNQGLVTAGIGSDNNGVLAGRPLWRMSRERWLHTFEECLEHPDESHLIRATVAFDFRPSSGGLEISSELADRVRRSREHPAFMRLMARSAAGFPVALGLRGQLATGREGDMQGRLNIKRGGVIPLVNLVRYHALAAGVTVSPTVDRIRAAADVGGLSRDLADGLSEAFELLTRIRLDHHAQLIDAGREPDNLIDPDELAPITRGELRTALGIVRRAQRQLGPGARAGR